MSTATPTVAKAALSVAQANEVIIDALTAKFRDQVANLVNDGTIGDGAVLTQAAIRIEYGNGKTVNWVTDDGQVFTTRSESTEFERPMAPAIPSAIKALDPAKSGGQPTEKAVVKAETAIRSMLRGFFATLETGILKERGWSRTLPGVGGKKYAGGRLGEIQKYADANEKVGL